MEEKEVLDGSILSASDREDLKDKHLTFWSDNQLFGIPIAEVVRIVSMQKITPVPEYPLYAKGIINLRGSIIPLIDVRLRLGREEAEYTDRTCIIVTHVHEHDFGFIVDAVDEVTTIPDEQVSPPPRVGSDSVNRYLTGIARVPDGEGRPEKIVLTVTTVTILGEDEFGALALGAQAPASA